MGLADRRRAIVVGIDFQGRLMELVYRHDSLVEDTSRLFRLADLVEVPIVVTEQYPRGLGPTVPALKEVLEQLATPVRWVEKVSFSCCGEPLFVQALDALREPGRRQIVLAGIEAHICIVQTCLDLLERGEEVFVSSECVTGRGTEARQWALERMRQAGAQIVSTESLAFEWARTKDHPAFKQISGLLKGAQLP